MYFTVSTFHLPPSGYRQSPYTNHHSAPIRLPQPTAHLQPSSMLQSSPSCLHLNCHPPPHTSSVIRLPSAAPQVLRSPLPPLNFHYPPLSAHRPPCIVHIPAPHDHLPLAPTIPTIHCPSCKCLANEPVSASAASGPGRGVAIWTMYSLQPPLVCASCLYQH
jgi:hypothetical protein